MNDINAYEELGLSAGEAEMKRRWSGGGAEVEATGGAEVERWWIVVDTYFEVSRFKKTLKFVSING